MYIDELIIYEGFATLVFKIFVGTIIWQHVLPIPNPANNPGLLQPRRKQEKGATPVVRSRKSIKFFVKKLTEKCKNYNRKKLMSKIKQQ